MTSTSTTRYNSTALQLPWWRWQGWKQIFRQLAAAYFQRAALWPLALSLLPVLAVIADSLFSWQALSSAASKPVYEFLAIPLTAAAAMAWLFQSLIRRSRLALVVCLQATIFCCREIHFAGTHSGVYIATAVLAGVAVAWLWRNRTSLGLEALNWRQISLLVASVATYVVAMLIQRRAFKFIPGEDALHVPLEEAAETGAHLLLLVAALAGNWQRKVVDSAATPPATAGR